MQQVVALTPGSKAWVFDFVMCAKIRALRQIMELFKFCKKWPDVVVHDVLPFYADMKEYAVNARLPYQFEYARLLLDVHTPGWKVDDPALCGLLADVRDTGSEEYRAWRQSVFARDSFVCRACGDKAGLCAHHIVPWAASTSLRYVVDNGITLCGDCHKKQHRDMRKQVWQ